MTAKINFDISPTGTLMTLLITGILGYFVYDCSVVAAIGVIGISIVVGLVMLLSLIPMVGWLTSMVISYYWVIPAMLDMMGLEHTWLITAIFIMSALSGLVITGMVTLAIIIVILRR